MKRKNNHQFGGALWSLKLAGAAVSVFASMPSEATVITIDSMATTQAYVTACPGNTPQAAAQSGAGIWGGTRILVANNVQGSGDPTECTRANVASSNPPAWKIANPEGVTGNGSIIWSGSSDPTGFAASPLDLEFLQYFNFEYVTADQATSFYVEVWSDATSCSKALIANLAANTSASNVQLNKAAFNSNCAANPADFKKIGRITANMAAAEALDTAFRAVTVVVGEPPVIGCTGSTINGVSNFQVPDDQCHDLTVSFSVSNTGGTSGLVTVLDQLASGMTQTGAVSCSNGLNFGPPVNPQVTWNSTNNLASGTSSTCTFQAQICGLAVGESRTNVIKASRTGETPVGSCDASVSRNAEPPPPVVVPTLTEWAQMIMMALMAISVGWFARRARMG
jgi:hypothetical protein